MEPRLKSLGPSRLRRSCECSSNSRRFSAAVSKTHFGSRGLPYRFQLLWRSSSITRARGFRIRSTPVGDNRKFNRRFKSSHTTLNHQAQKAQKCLNAPFLKKNVEKKRWKKRWEKIYHPIMSSHSLHSFRNYTRRAIFPETCKINQSSVDFHWLIDWLTKSQLLSKSKSFLQ